jgi:hypothetical protein
MTPSEQVLVECLKMKDERPAPAMLFDRREILLDINGTPDRSYVLDIVAEGDEASCQVKPKAAVELKGGLQKALDILRRLYRRYEDNLKASKRPAVYNAYGVVEDQRGPTVDQGRVHRVFRRLALKWHPDMGGSDIAMAAANDFYSALSTQTS